MCGVCGRSTTIPSTNILDTLGKEWRDMERNSSKIYYDLRKSPYVTCSRCDTHVLLFSDTEEELKSIQEMGMESYHSIACTSCGLEIPYVSPRRGDIVLPNGEMRRTSQPLPPTTQTEELRRSSQPSELPSSFPSAQPSTLPSSFPFSQPSELPSSFPFSQPSGELPSSFPSSQPTTSTTSVPSGYTSVYPDIRKLTPSEIEDAQPGLSAPVSFPPQQTQQMSKINSTDPRLVSSKTSTLTTRPDNYQQGISGVNNSGF